MIDWVEPRDLDWDEPTVTLKGFQMAQLRDSATAPMWGSPMDGARSSAQELVLEMEPSLEPHSADR